MSQPDYVEGLSLRLEKITTTNIDNIDLDLNGKVVSLSGYTLKKFL